MQKFTIHSGIAAPLLLDNVNTDQIAPSQHGRELKPDYARMLFRRQRFLDDGRENPDFVLNQDRFRHASILVAGANFGCGSSREAGVWTMTAFGIRCIIARSFSDIYRENCLQNGVLPLVLPEEAIAPFEARVLQADGQAPFSVDLEKQVLSGPHGPDIAFQIDPVFKFKLLRGLDDIGLTLSCDVQIREWEERTTRDLPFLQHLHDARLTG